MCSIASFATVKDRGSAPNRSVQTALHHAKAQRAVLNHALDDGFSATELLVGRGWIPKIGTGKFP